MKKLFNLKSIRFFCLMIMGLFINAILFAQDSSGSTSVTTTTHTETQTWYMEPWVWVVGGAVFILILVALARSGKSTDRTIITKTTNTTDRGV
ncbi:MAG: hypothetical protein ABIY35_01605 [Chitinophagaceae bacterium]